MMGMVGQRVVNGVWQKVVQWMLRKQMVQRVDGRLRVRGGRVIMARDENCLEMLFRQKKVFLDHVFFFFFNGKPGQRGPTLPILMENSINFFCFVFETFPYAAMHTFCACF